MSDLFQWLRESPAQVSAAVALLALIVSFASIILTVVALYLQRQHNYKSVTPIASFPIADYENRITVKLKNTGIGPLLVETIRVTDGKEERHDVISWMPDLPDGIHWATFYGKADGACIPPGSELVLLELSGNPDDPKFAEARTRCRQVLRRLTVSVVYRDIYRRSMPLGARNLSWFGRHFQ